MQMLTLRSKFLYNVKEKGYLFKSSKHIRNNKIMQ